MTGWPYLPIHFSVTFSWGSLPGNSDTSLAFLVIMLFVLPKLISCWIFLWFTFYLVLNLKYVGIKNKYLFLGKCMEYIYIITLTKYSLVGRKFLGSFSISCQVKWPFLSQIFVLVSMDWCGPDIQCELILYFPVGTQV